MSRPTDRARSGRRRRRRASGSTARTSRQGGPPRARSWAGRISGSTPTAFQLQAAGQLGNPGRGALTGPDLRTVDLALVKHVRWERLGPAGNVELRVEAFNVFNRGNLGIPGLIAFAGQRDSEQPLPTFGRIRQTVTASRQVQLGLRVQF